MRQAKADSEHHHMAAAELATARSRIEERVILERLWILMSVTGSGFSPRRPIASQV